MKIKAILLFFIFISILTILTSAITHTLAVESTSVTLEVPFFSQRDPAWCDQKLDNSPYSIYSYGCALTSTAMISKYFGYDTNPGRLNATLTQNGGLGIDGILHWDKVEDASGGKVDWIGRVDGADWNRIEQELNQGYPVIAEVYFSNKQHFIIFQGNTNTDYHFYDPWDKTCVDREWPNGALGTYTLKGLRIFHGTPAPTPTPSPTPTPTPMPTPLTEIYINGSDAVLNQTLHGVSVPTNPYPVENIFTHNTEAIFKQDLFSVSIPTPPLPIEGIFIVHEEASFYTNLYTVSIPTEPSPITEIFIHLEEAKAYEDLIFPKELVKDTTPPIITNVTATNITDNSATINWDTDEFADSLVKYGKTSGIYTESVKEMLYVKNHTIDLTELASGTTYYFMINSADRSGNSAESAEYRFTTSGLTPTPTPSPTPTPTPTPTPSIFDTGPGTYPSIFGTHNGTIKPNQTITVSKLYTYPCPGTGGHSEYMKIWNNSDSNWNVTARWEGYSGDWHNILFDNSFTLEAGETYNYTIRTGSYPQIHHTDNLSTPAGFITCTEFIDTNGKRYKDWIPAIRLE